MIRERIEKIDNLIADRNADLEAAKRYQIDNLDQIKSSDEI